MKIRIDDEPFEVDNNEMIMEQMLELAGVSTTEHYIVRIEADGSYLPYRAINFKLSLHNGDRFVTVYTGACTAQ